MPSPKLLTTIAALVLSLAFGGSAAAAGLVEILREARANDAGYAAARSAWQAAQERLPQGQALLLPSASLSATTNYNDRQISGAGATFGSRYNANSLQLSITQPLYRPQNLAQYEQAKIQVTQADAQLAAALQDLILRVSQAYFDILLAQNNVELARAQKAAISEQLAQAKRNFEVGTATITDTHEAQARFDLVRAQEIAALNELEIRQRALQQIIGKQPPPVAPLGREFELVVPEPNNMDAWVEEAVANNLQVQVQRAAEAFALREVERNRAAHYPTVDAVASINRSAGPSAATGLGVPSRFDTDVNTIGLQLAVPLYQGGAIDSRVREALANLERSRQELENARRTVALNARQAFLGVTSGIAQVGALQSAVVSSQSQLESTRLGQEVGVRTGVDVLNAQQQLFSARRDLAQARYNYILSSLRLKLAAGRLTENDVVQVDQWLAR